MTKYGSKTKKISLFLILAGVILAILSVLSLWINPAYSQGLILISVLSLFVGFLIYFVLYRQFLKLERIE
jgi:Flp pilus assembly protein TadB